MVCASTPAESMCHSIPYHVAACQIWCERSSIVYFMLHYADSYNNKFISKNVIIIVITCK